MQLEQITATHFKIGEFETTQVEGVWLVRKQTPWGEWDQYPNGFATEKEAVDFILKEQLV